MRSDDNDPTEHCPFCGGVLGDHLQAIAPLPDPMELAAETQAEVVLHNLRKIERFDPDEDVANFEHNGTVFFPGHRWLLRYREGLLARRQKR